MLPEVNPIFSFTTDPPWSPARFSPPKAENAPNYVPVTQRFEAKLENLRERVRLWSAKDTQETSSEMSLEEKQGIFNKANRARIGARDWLWRIPLGNGFIIGIGPGRLLASVGLKEYVKCSWLHLVCWAAWRTCLVQATRRCLVDWVRWVKSCGLPSFREGVRCQ